MSDLLDEAPYPVTVAQARYSGAYEGGAWIAFPCHPESYELVSGEYEGWAGNDTEARVFWDSTRSHFIGRGKTPNDAVIDLVKRLTPILEHWNNK